MTAVDAAADKADAPISVTVVFLEMRRPPSTAVHPPLNTHIAVLRARTIGLSFYRYLMDRVGRQWHWVSRLRLSDDELEAMLRDPKCEVSVLYLDGSPAGFFELYGPRDDRVELSYFGLMEHATGRGLGRWFLSAAVEAAWALRPATVAVQTCTLDHPAALPLYQKVGFSPVGTTEEVIVPMSLAERAEVLARP